MTSDSNFRVTDRDKAIMARTAAALAEFENDDEGTPEWRAAVIANLNARRALRGIPPLKEWWEDLPEMEVHRLAKSRGLLSRVR